ncbi:hypothetical protein JW898_01615 [Candidatus Woesearchaeota archaeon]|nr:hypothetical protein [Candidatus Woesearchaeota archaeon]
MTNGNVDISNPFILQAIRYLKFGALIEVTNGMLHMDKRQEKKRQVKRGKALLQKSVGGSAEIAGGLALIKNEVPEIRELDFSVQIAGYNPQMLYEVTERLLATDFIDDRDKETVRKIMDLAENRRYLTLQALLNPTAETYRRLPRSMRAGYNDDVARVKGAVLEVYVARLMKQALNYDSVFALGTTLKDREVVPERTIHTDLIIAAPKPDFKNALERLVEIYSSRKTQEIKVVFNEGFR